MERKMVLTALFLAMIPFSAYAAPAEDAVSPPTDNTTPRSDKTSYFQGVWTGSWPGFSPSEAGQDVTITIGREIRENNFVVIYSWEEVTWRTRIIPGGKVKTEGRAQNDEFHIKWTNKKGRDFEIILMKAKDNEVKARLEKSGPSASGERPYNETSLHRK